MITCGSRGLRYVIRAELETLRAESGPQMTRFPPGGRVSADLFVGPLECPPCLIIGSEASLNEIVQVINIVVSAALHNFN